MTTVNKKQTAKATLRPSQSSGISKNRGRNGQPKKWECPLCGYQGVWRGDVSAHIRRTNNHPEMLVPQEIGHKMKNEKDKKSKKKDSEKTKDQKEDKNSQAKKA